MKNTISIHEYESPCGELMLMLGSLGNQLCLCDWQNEERRYKIDARLQKGLNAVYKAQESEIIAQAVIQLDEYFHKKRTAFDIPLLLVGTDFQKAVWNSLREVPYGSTESYGGLSKRMNNPEAIRAVAAANGANAISIFIPCHRIIGNHNRLVGYAGGLPAKKKLLELESSSQGGEEKLF